MQIDEPLLTPSLPSQGSENLLTPSLPSQSSEKAQQDVKIFTFHDIDQKDGPREQDKLFGTRYEDNADPRRWWVLICVNMFVCFTVLQAYSYYFLGTTAMQYLNINESELLLLVDVNNIIILLFSYVASWYAFKKFRLTILICCLSSMIGGWIKYASQGNYISVLVSQAFFALALSSAAGLAVLMPYRWFPMKERLFATTISISQFNIAVIISQIFPFWINIDRIPVYNLFLAMITSIPFIMGFFVIQNEPKIPPSYTAFSVSMILDENSFLDEIKAALKNRGFVVFVIMFGISIGGSFSQFYASIQLFRVLNISSSTQNILAISNTVLGVLAANILTLYLGNQKAYNYDRLIKILLSLALGSTLIMGLWSFYFKDVNSILMMILFSLSGIGYAGMMPFAYISLAESTFPLPETITSNSLSVIQGIISTILNRILVLSAFQNTALITIVIFSLPSWIYTLFYFKTQYQRRAIDKEHGKIGYEEVQSLTMLNDDRRTPRRMNQLYFKSTSLSPNFSRYPR